MFKKLLCLSLMLFILGISGIFAGTAQAIDTDGDGIFDDGDGSGVVGDNPCRSGNTINCDDNCRVIYNPEQFDVDGDGIGNACEDNAIDVGSGGYSVISGSLPDITNKELTVEAWVKSKTSNLNGGILTQRGFLWVKGNEPKFGISTYPTSTPDKVVSSLGAMLANMWYHIAGVLTNSAHTHPVSTSCSTAVMAETPHMDIYVNGEFKNCATTGSSFAANPAASDMYIGKLRGGDYWPLFDGLPLDVIFNGVIDEVRFWTVARTEAEIQQCMNYELGTVAGCEIDSSILKGYWRLDEGMGTVVTDSSGNGYSGVGSGLWVNGYQFTNINDDLDGDGYMWLQGDCNDSDGLVYPGASDVCDGKDNDCNISTGDGASESWMGAACDGTDTDVCMEGVFQCTGGVKICSDTTGSTVEVCDGIDNDCDGATDEGLGTITCGIGVCQRTINNCVGGQSQVCAPGTPTENPETTCSDNLDNDCDSLTDQSDTDCANRDNALDFSRDTGGRIQVTGSSLPDIGNKEITVEARIKGNAADLTGGIFSAYTNPGSDFPKGVELWAENNVVKFGIRPYPTSTTPFVIKSLGSMLRDAWYHIAGVFTNSSHNHPESTSCTAAVMAQTPHLDIYVNGQFKGCGTTGPQFIASPSIISQMFIGRSVYGMLDGGAWDDRKKIITAFPGLIDEVRLWNVARTEAEIQQCMNSELGTVPGCSVDSSILKGYWRIDEGIGTVATDSSGNGYSGNILNDSGSLWSGGWTGGYPFTGLDTDTDGDGYAMRQGDCNDNDALVKPGAADVCDGKDNDCNISTGDGASESWMGAACDGTDTDVCMEGVFQCTGGVKICSDTTGSTVEVCDGIDNDCDISTSDGSVESWLGDACDGADTDLCVEGVFQCTNGTKTCSDSTGSTVEVCDGIDNDCDGVTDENLGTTTCGIGVCQRTINNCVNGQQVCTPGSPTESTETTCSDNLDNDCDSFTDQNDTDCTVRDNAIDFSSGGYSVISGSLPDIVNKELTVEAWVKSKTSNLNGGILTQRGFLWVKGNVPKFGISTYPTSTPNTVVGSLGSMLSDVWYHIAGILTNFAHTHPVSASCSTAVMAETPHMDIYVNGEFKNCATTGSSFATNPDSDMYIGKLRGGVSYNMFDGLSPDVIFNGVIDEVRFWTVARTEAELNRCMNYELGTVAGCEIDPAILKGYWRFDEGMAAVITDSSGNGYSGVGSGSWVNGYQFTNINDDWDGDGYTWLQGDCNDGDGLVYPGASEVCDGKDNDCDISTSDGSVESWLGAACDGTDTDLCVEGIFTCTNGTKTCSDNTGSTVEVCDGIDNDCNGLIDENLVRTTTCGAGQCSNNTGTETCIAGIWANNTCDPFAGATAESCDNIDNDCDGITDEGLVNVTRCGVGACFGNTGSITCIAGSWVNNNCDALAGAIPEIPNNSVDDDCNLLTYDSSLNTDDDGDGYSEMQGDCDDTNAAIYPGAVEIIGNFKDDDCNPFTYDSSPDTDDDGDGYSEGFEVIRTNSIIGYTSMSAAVNNANTGDCDDTNSAIQPGTTEILFNGIDDDCNPLTLDSPPDTDDDGDGYSENAGDCDDTKASVHPGAAEICDGADNNCDGNTDESPDLDGDTWTICDGDCDDGNVLVNPGTAEIINDGTDNDCNATTPVRTASGNSVNQPTAGFNASMSLNADESNLGGSWLKYYYTRSRINLVSTSIMGLSVSGNTATVTAAGSVNGAPNYTFTATITDGSPDGLGIEIRKPDGTLYFKDPSGGGTRTLTKGDFNIVRD